FRARRRTARRQESPRCDLRSLSAPLSTDSDDDDGGDARGVAAGAGHRHRLGTAAAARHCHHRRTDRQPDADAVHHTRRVSLFRQTAAVARAHLRDRLAGASRGRSVRRRLIVLAVALSAIGCTIGPTYHRPVIAGVPAFKEAPPDGWKEAQPNDGIPHGRWWEMYDDPQLNELAAKVQLSNQNVIAAMARYQQARDQVRLARAA